MGVKNMDFKYRAFQYTRNGFRIVVELPTPATKKEMIRRVMSEFATIELNKYPNWEPIEDEEYYEMPQKPVCDYCPRLPNEPCDQGCNCDQCRADRHEHDDFCDVSCPQDKAVDLPAEITEHDVCDNCEEDVRAPNSKFCTECNAIMVADEREMFDIYGGDPRDERTWFGSEPDQPRWGDQI